MTSFPGKEGDRFAVEVGLPSSLKKVAEGRMMPRNQWPSRVWLLPHSFEEAAKCVPTTDYRLPTTSLLTYRIT